MSAIATLTRLPLTALPGLQSARSAGALEGQLRWHRAGQVTFQGAGIVMATLLAYLQEREGIDLMHSSLDPLANHLSQALGNANFVVTETQKRDFLDRLEPSRFSEAALRDYCNEFNEWDEDATGRVMLEGIRALREAMLNLDDGAVVLLSIG